MAIVDNGCTRIELGPIEPNFLFTLWWQRDTNRHGSIHATVTTKRKRSWWQSFLEKKAIFGAEVVFSHRLIRMVLL